jgi:hypothetical protein
MALNELARRLTNFTPAHACPIAACPDEHG